MARESKKEKTNRRRVPMRYVLIAGLCGIALSSAIFASQQVEQFLIRDPRFFLPGPADYGLESPNLEIHGVHYASRWRVQRVFTPDFGRSLYLFPLADRRAALLRVSWVKDASILRIWPNRVVVHIVERAPAAFIESRVESISRWALIDSDGVILDPPRKADFHLPVITGVRSDEKPESRGVRVRRMQRMLVELGKLADNVSEVNVADLDNLRITEQVSGRTVVLIVGDSNFASRVRNFLDHYPDIHRKMPSATTFDVRLDDRITALGEGNKEEARNGE
jgi:cell division protein FtsQ